MHDFTITPFQGNEVLKRIRTYGDLQAALITERKPKILAALRRKNDSIHHIQQGYIQGKNYHLIISHKNRKMTKFTKVTQKLIYSELIHEQSTDHFYKTKWGEAYMELVMTDWDRVWDSIHQGFFTESVKSTIWEQV